MILLAATTLAQPATTLSTKSTDTATSTSVTTTSTSTSSSADPSTAVATGDPAAVLVLGESIDAIQRPATVADLAGALTSGFGDGSIPTAFGLELAPFWLTGGARRLSIEQYASGRGAALHNLNASFAITNAADTGPRAALALRTTVWGKPREGSAIATFLRDFEVFRATGATPTGEVNACVATLERLAAFSDTLNVKVAEAVRAEVQGTVREAQAAVKDYCTGIEPTATPTAAGTCRAQDFATAPPAGLPADPMLDTATGAELAQAIQDMNEAAAAAEKSITTKTTEQLAAFAKDPTLLEGPLGAYAKEQGLQDALGGCATLLTEREGWVVDLAAGAGVEAPETKLANLAGTQITGWVAPGYVWARASLYGMVRYAYEDPGPEGLHVGLVGLGGAREWERFTVSLAGVARIPLDGSTPSSSLSLGTDLRVRDGLWLSTGLKLGIPGEEEGTFVTLAGIKVGAEDTRTLTPTTQDLPALSPG